MYRILENVNTPEDLKKLSQEELCVLAVDIRNFLIDAVSKTGGHLASNLGVVELTIALHYCFNSPTDKIIWDVGHQAYVHKILTGRKDQFQTLRQLDGLSGFLKSYESEHDCFDAGHSSTSLSAGLGMALARDLRNEKNEVISVIGDGALTGGMALEALNYLGHCKTNMKIILNDNEMSISENVGGLSKSLARIRTTQKYAKLKDDTKSTLSRIPSIGDSMIDVIGKVKDSFKYLLVDGGLFFEELGITYIGPINGHDIDSLIQHMKMLKDVNGPVVLHVLTQKGKGYDFSESNPNRYHGVGAFNPEIPLKSSTKSDYSKLFGNELCKMAENDKRIVAISAAMIDGTGLLEFSKKYPERMIDVGIAEQNAVTLAGGLASRGLKPFVAIYSTFLQRAYDQILHDICIQKLPVVFCIDRAGLVGNDGETHHGVFDLSYLSHMPNMTILSPKDGSELKQMMTFAQHYSKGPIAIRYPRGAVYEWDEDIKVYSKSGLEVKEIFPPQVLILGHRNICITTGKMTATAIEAIENLGDKFDIGLINISKIKPFDETTLLNLIKKASVIITIEDNTVIGGLGDAVNRVIIKNLGIFDASLKVENLGIKDEFVPQGETEELMARIDLDVQSVQRKMIEVCCE